MKSELNDIKDNIINPSELNDIVTINDTISGDNPIDDNESASESLEPTQISVKPKKKSNINLMQLMSSVAVVAAVGTVAIATTVTNKVNLDIAFDDFVVTDTSIEYGVNVSDYEATELTLQIINDFTLRSVEIVDNYVSGSFEELSPNMSYTIQVVMPGVLGSDKVLAYQSINTLSTADYKTARFVDIKTECKCHVDGYFYFTMNFIDNVNSYSDFEAYLEDESGNTSYCEWNENYHAEQKIAVLDTTITGDRATLYIYCYNNESNERILCYQVEVAI